MKSTTAKTADSMSAGENPWLVGLNENQVASQLAFYKMRVKHPKLDAVIESLMPLLAPHTENNIIAIVGATGIGKSTLTKVMLQSLMKESDMLMNADPTTIPVVYVQAGQDGSTKYGIKQLYQELISLLNEPCVEKKTPATQTDGRIVIESRAKTTTRTLRATLKEALKQRRTSVVVIDEAALLRCYGKSEDVSNTIKTLAQLAPNTKWLLAGAFDLFDLLKDGQVLRRSALLSMTRYKHDDAADRAEFKDIVRKLQAKWPVPEHVPQLTAISDELLEVTLGCVGHLKALMLEISAQQMRANGAWNSQFLKNAAKPPGARRKMEDEMLKGERLIADYIYGTSNWDDEMFGEMELKMQVAESELRNAI